MTQLLPSDTIALIATKPEHCLDCFRLIRPGETWRIWALAEDAGKGGFNCGLSSNIWNNSERDPAVLYDEQGREMDSK